VTDLLRRARKIFGQRRLELVIGHRLRWGRRPTPEQRRELVELMRRCPGDEDELERWREMEVLAGCLRIIRSGLHTLTADAVSEGIKMAAETLTVVHVFRRYGFAPPDEDNNGGRRYQWDPGKLNEGTLLRARAAMVEASSRLRNPPLPFYADLVHLATTGMSQDMSDESPGLKQGEVVMRPKIWPPLKQWERFKPDAKV
jgi:hypothetical protein